MNQATFLFPGISHRTSVIGRTGSGKTVMGAWLLSEQPFDRMPYIVIDYKGDELFDGLDRIKEIGLDELPKQPGLYRIRPRPELDDEATEAWLMRVWERERTGLFVDETYMLPNKGAFRGILTQGRSKRIPVLALSQRPSFLPLFVFSEADFFAVFHLSIHDDKLKVKRMINGNAVDPLPEYHSWWYDVKHDQRFIMKPAPSPDEIQQRIDDRLQPKRRFA